MTSLDPLERLMAKFDITGQQGVADRLSPTTPVQAPQPSPASAAQPNSAPEIRRTMSLGRKSRPPTRRQQIKHAMTVNAAHVITQDYITLSQPLAEGVLLMDRTDRKLKLVHSLGELQPLHRYTTEYGNSLVRRVKHKAVLADSIEIDVLTDEVDFDKQLEKSAIADHSGTLQLAQRQATYRAFSSFGKMDELSTEYEGSVTGTEIDDGTSIAGAMFNGQRLEEAAALQRLDQLTSRLVEMEEWFSSVKSEAASERQIREQATARLELLQERLERLQTQLAAETSENQLLRAKLEQLERAEPEALLTRAKPHALGTI